MNQIIGILGGMGPRATVRFEQMLLDRLPGTDQQLPTIISLNDGSIPDRSLYLLGSGESPVPRLQQNLRILEQAGATIVCIPCNTACAPRIFEQLQVTSGRLISLPEEVVKVMRDRHLRRVCLLATEGTIAAQTYQRLCSAQGITCVVPDSRLQRMVTDIIRSVKSGQITRACRTASAASRLIELLGCDSVIFGCTELPHVGNHLAPVATEAVDSLAVLADACARYTSVIPVERAQVTSAASFSNISGKETI